MDGRSRLGIYLRGVCMGAADAVPGVSGGTIAFLTGIYERLIAAVTAVDADRIRRVLAAPLPGRRRDAYEAFLEVDGWFLVLLGAGIATAVVTVSRVLDVAMESYPAPTFGFFFGLIAASAWVLRDEAAFDTPGRVAAGVAGFTFAFVVSGRASTTLGHGPLVTVVAAAVAVSAMILPGISGSLILLVLGQYEFLVGTLRAFVDAIPAVLSGDVPAGFVGDVRVILAFFAGALVGLFTVAHAVRFALERRYEATLTFLVALVVGALRAPVVEAGRTLAEHGTGWTQAAILAFVGAAVVGAALVVGLERVAGEIEPDAAV